MIDPQTEARIQTLLEKWKISERALKADGRLHLWDQGEVYACCYEELKAALLSDARPRPAEEEGLTTIAIDAIAERVHNNGQLSVLTWAKERLDNTLRIATTKTGEDRDGWLEDAAYWREIVTILSATRPRPEEEKERHGER